MRSLDKIIEGIYEEYRVNYNTEDLFNGDEVLPPPTKWHEVSSWRHYGYHEVRTIRLIHAILDKASKAELLTSPNKYIRNYAKRKEDDQELAVVLGTDIDPGCG